MPIELCPRFLYRSDKSIDEPAPELKPVHNQGLTILACHRLDTSYDKESFVICRLLFRKQLGDSTINKLLIKLLSQSSRREGSDNMVVAVLVINFTSATNTTSGRPCIKYAVSAFVTLINNIGGGTASGTDNIDSGRPIGRGIQCGAFRRKPDR